MPATIAMIMGVSSNLLAAAAVVVYYSWVPSTEPKHKPKARYVGIYIGMLNADAIF